MWTCTTVLVLIPTWNFMPFVSTVYETLAISRYGQRHLADKITYHFFYFRRRCRQRIVAASLRTLCFVMHSLLWNRLVKINYFCVWFWQWTRVWKEAIGLKWGFQREHEIYHSLLIMSLPSSPLPSPRLRVTMKEQMKRRHCSSQHPVWEILLS